MEPVPGRRYPIGIQTYAEIRREGYLYIDKTPLIHRLAHENGKAFFLSRPRRFGKSLLLSTMQAYFEGQRKLFEGTALEHLETDWEASPVLRVDLSVVKTRDLNELRTQLGDILSELEESVVPNEDRPETLGGRFKKLIQTIAARAGKQVVVLVDEYDAPLLNVVDTPELLAQFRQVMREFYIPLKACDADLRFVFLTGITKFSQLSIFSELNNLRNISMDPTYAAICGITEDELTGTMAPDIERLATHLNITPSEAFARLKEHYDGYHFCDPSPDIYNPFSLLNAFAEGRIRSFWFGSGTPTALIELIRSHGWNIIDLTACEADEADFDAPTEQMVTPLAMLYQAGYLTVKSYDPDLGSYMLGIPNQEVSRGLSQSLVRHAAPDALRTHNLFSIDFTRCVRAGDMNGALERMRAYLAGIPYHLGSRDERGFETTFYLIFDLLGARIRTEFQTAKRRIDAVIWAADATYVIELKYGKSAAEALAQIDQKDYLVPFTAGDTPVVKVGVNFSPEKQTIDDWIIERG